MTASRTGRIVFLAAILAMPAAAQDRKVAGGKKTDFGTPNFAISTPLGMVPDKSFEEMVEGLFTHWKGKLGQASNPGKINLALYFNRAEFAKAAGPGGSHRLKEKTLHVFCDPLFFQSIASGGTRVFLAAAYPNLAARKDLPPWVETGLSDYFSCARWQDGKVALDSIKAPEVNMSILSFQNLIRSSDWTPFEKSFKAEGREYEIRRRVVDAQGWAVFYFLFNGPESEGGRGKHAGLVPATLAALNEGKSIDEVVRTVFKTDFGGSLAALERAVKEYFQKIKVDLQDREEANWLIGETAHYVLQVQKGAMNKKTKAGDRQILQELKWKMELLFEKYSLAFRFSGRLPRKASLKLYRDRSAYLSGGGPGGSAAYYNPGTKELVGYEDSGETGIVFQILCHEGCHQFFDLAFPGFYESEDLPMWFSEGLADCFGASEIRGRDLYVFTLGGVAAWRVDEIKQMVQSNRAASIKDLLQMNRQTFMSGANLYYPQAWSFTHFLWNYPSLDAGKGQYHEVVVRLIDGFKVGKSRDEVYKEAFQLKGKPLHPDDLEKEWKAYVKTLRVRK